MNPKVGLVCDLTEQVADFEDTCQSFSKDLEAEQAQFERKMAATGDYLEGDPLDYNKNKSNGAIIFTVGCGITLLSHLFLEPSGIMIFAYGPVVYGGFLYFKGVDQEKLAKEKETKEDGTL